MMPTKHPVIFLNSNFRFASKIVEEHPLNLDNFLETIFAPGPPPINFVHGSHVPRCRSAQSPSLSLQLRLTPLRVLALAQKVS